MTTDSPDIVVSTKEGILVRLHVQPKASKDKVCGIHGDRLKVAVQAPPAKGKANTSIIRLFSKLLNIPKANIHIKSGTSSRQKNIIIEGCSLEDVRNKLLAQFL